MNGGSITKRSEGVYEVALQTGFNPITKKYGRISRRVHGTKKDALAVLDEMKQQLRTGLKPNAGKVTFGEFSQQWFERGKQSGEWTTATIQRYTTMLKQLNTYLATVELQSIDAQTVDALYMALKADTGMSNTTLQKVHTLLKQIMKQAELYDLILRNPCNRIKAPRKGAVERRSLTQQEGARFLACLRKAEKEAYSAYKEKEARQTERGNLFGRSYLMDLSEVSRIIGAHIGLGTGARRGEVLGLTWQHINFDTMEATIAQSVAASGEVKEPKTEAGKRTVTLDKELVDTLATWKAFQASQLLRIGVKATESIPIVCDAKGGYMNPCNFSRWWRSFTTAQGFKGLKFHELRHTQATMLIASGLDSKTVADRLGHAKPSITMDMYTHSVKENDRRAAEMIGKLFGQPQEATRIINVKTA